ncbi:16S rRNA (guanine(966)-N(2))-methyltransferase RsmD [Leeia aquatica]|uniref:16S rRNA (Guanine(966)-N(2))-methyltransferase RsmD n=1 Tax=Leeia aquatica TaxID=2725557 RepID=A0A847SFX4_9NEIS|nr:16S rRNA (guanine(966)-N(2))-methyltransferase RsmD [Leeia aquatica]NLR76139.1 16S rRNA (guanine(966)-N(2))-methyltransferase RsmD [Leeia aquatica]
MLRNQVRIIGGQWRRRLLSFPDGDGLRPTSDRVRETVFNWLGQDLHGQSCLDLFAGSGALSFEAASRHAARVVALELSHSVVRQLKQNRQLLQAQQIDIVPGDALQWLRQSSEQFDVIFADPPFAANLLPAVLPLVAARLKPGGRLYIEGEHLPELPAEWTIQRQGKAGRVSYALLQRSDQPA